jgi:hypothetical protein
MIETIGRVGEPVVNGARVTHASMSMKRVAFYNMNIFNIGN